MKRPHVAELVSEVKKLLRRIREVGADGGIDLPFFEVARRQAEMVVRPVDELLQECRDPAFGKPFEAVFREDEAEPEFPARVVDFVIVVTDRVKAFRA